MKKTATKMAVLLTILLYLPGTAVWDSHFASAKQVETNIRAPEKDPKEGLGGDVPLYHEDMVNDFSVYEGVWLGEENNPYDHIEFDTEGNWKLYQAGHMVDKGYLRYEPQWDAVYAYSEDDSGSPISLEDGQLYIASFGDFHYGEGMAYYWYAEGDGDHDGAPPAENYYSWNSALCQRNVSEFQGVWYFDGNLAAKTFLVIDGQGHWSYYQRAPGDSEATEMDRGILSYSTDEISTYYADSTKYDGLSIRVYEKEAHVLIWGDEGAYYLME